MSEHNGKGGSYVITEAGEKVLTHRTDHVVEQTPAPAPAPAVPPRKLTAKAPAAAPGTADQL
jgi:hypothetical protein